jgi:sacsin
MKSSDLSRTTYDRDKVKDLVRSLRADAHHMLLFLRNLQSIEVYEKESSSSQEAKKLLEIRIVPSYLDLVRRQCTEFQRQVKVDWKRQKAVSATYPLAISVEDYTNSNRVKETCVWIVSQYYAGAEESPSVSLSNDKGYLPLVGVALPLDVSIKEPLCKTEPKGHVFCFLPLPLEKKSPTGLQFHVHGSFAIDQNRRHIKWPSADLEMLTLRDDRRTHLEPVPRQGRSPEGGPKTDHLPDGAAESKAGGGGPNSRRRVEPENLLHTSFRWKVATL